MHNEAIPETTLNFSRYGVSSNAMRIFFLSEKENTKIMLKARIPTISGANLYCCPYSRPTTVGPNITIPSVIAIPL